MIIHFFTKEDELPGCSRQRAFRVAEELNAHGVGAVVHRPSAVQISITPWPKKFGLIMQIIKALGTIKKGDIVYLQRAISNKYFFVIMVAYLLVFRRRMIFDFDDAIYMHNYYKTMIFTRMADAVIVGGHVLETWARQFNKNVYIVHTSLKYETYQRFSRRYEGATGSAVIGWVGTAKDHYKNLELLASVFERLLAKNVQFSFVLVGLLGHEKTYELFRGIEDLQVTFIDRLEYKNPEAVPRSIQPFDIGVMPLVNRGEWNLARSSFKPLEYMACGVATMCSSIGEVNYLITDGKDGMLADTEDEWVEKLELLINDRKLCETLGQAGQERVRLNYCYEAIVPRMIDIFNSLAAKAS